MRILLVGPNIEEKDKLGGIITVVNIILGLFPQMEFFSRSSKKDGNTFKSFRDFFLILRDFKRLMKTPIDLVHINTALEDNAMARDILLCYMARRNKKQILLHIHGGKYFSYTPSTFSSKMIKILFSYADAIIVLSEKEQDILKTDYLQSDVHILPNALNFDEIPSGEKKFKTEEISLIYLGRIAPFKGLEDILIALKTIKDENKIPFKFNLYGNGQLLESYVNECNEKLGENFCYAGVVSGEQKWKALNSNDIFLLPSLYEGVPMSLLEAMAVGCICITTAVGSIPLVVRHQENGFIVGKSSPEEIIKALKWINANRLEAVQLAQKGKETVEKSFNGNIYREKLQNIYNQIA